MEYGRPCGNSGTEVCCSNTPPPTTAPVYAPVTSAPTQTYGSTYAPAPSFNPIAIHPTEAPPVQQPVYVAPPAPQPVDQSYLPPPVQQPVYVPPATTAVPYVQCSYSQECVQESVCAARFGQFGYQNTAVSSFPPLPNRSSSINHVILNYLNSRNAKVMEDWWECAVTFCHRRLLLPALSLRHLHNPC